MVGSEVEFQSHGTLPGRVENITSLEGTPLSRFVDAFLHPRNIQWLLIAGVLILLASSLMLVSSNWQDYTPAWKYLILLSYTAGTWIVGRWSYSRLGLRRTGTVILSLAVLLMPVSFLALNIVGLTGPPWMGLFAMNLALASVAARDVFRHLLRADQPTFLLSYLLLCGAGSFISSPMSGGVAAIIALCFWAIFAVGAVKVNRHVFWLAEEHRWPRIFGFFPILLLGTQFLILYALGPARHLPVQWMGLGCALVAAVVLTTADAVARVFQQRTGDLVRPLPWAVVAPLAAGLTLCALALVLAATGLASGGLPYAVVPTAVLVAGLMALVARRTHKSAFVWAALLVVTVAYNFSSVFFASIAREFISHGASAVREERLPYPFYGLTYLPLLAGLLGLGGVAVRRGWTLVVGPVRQYSLGLSGMLLLVSAGHPKAIFPVAITMTAALAAHVAVFRDRRGVSPAIIAWIGAGAGFCGFLRGVAGIDLPSPAGEMISLTFAAAVLSVSGIFVDRLLHRLTGKSLTCTASSLCLTVVLAATWIGLFGWSTPAIPEMLAGSAIALLLLAHAIWRLESRLSAFAIVFVQFVVFHWALSLGMSLGNVLSLTTIGLFAQWLVAGFLKSWRQSSETARAFASSARSVAAVELAGILTAVCLPVLWARALFSDALVPNDYFPSILVAPLIIAWAVHVARRWASRGIATIACLTALGFAGAMLVYVTGSNTYLLATLGVASIFGIGISEWVSRRHTRAGDRVLAEAAMAVSVATLVIIALSSLVFYETPVRVAAVISIVGLFIAGRLRRLPANLRTQLLGLANLQVLAQVLVAVAAPAVTSALEVRLDLLISASMPLGALSALSVLAWQCFGPKLDDSVARRHRGMLRLITLTCLGASLSIHAHGLAGVVLAVATFAAMIASEWWSACRYSTERRVWTGELLILAAAAYFAAAGVITFGGGLSLYVPLFAALAFGGAALLVARRQHAVVLSRPFRQTSRALPLGTVGIAIAHAIGGSRATWLGMSSLAVMLAAGFYFWHGMASRQPRWHVLAACIANVALALLWHDLRLSDPQFYMIPLGASVLLLVQLLKRELPATAHDPIRYIGALLILVSPTFHIVEGSWLHLLSLMLLSVIVIVAAIGLRVRAILYAGTAFLIADLVAMVVRGSIDRPGVLWISGLAVGAGVLALGALAERNREQLLQRVRTISAALAVWD